METFSYVIAGAGVTGLAFANFVASDDYIVIERDREPGGYCKTVRQDGFIWDYSGHFFHFRNAEIEEMLRKRMPPDIVKTVNRRAFVFYRDQLIEYPFQKNIHQLPRVEFIECLHDLFLASESPAERPTSFKRMVYARFGRGIAGKFLLPYNEKLYACDLETLDADAMGRFFPYADLRSIIRNMRAPDNASYNSSFTYPFGGAGEYVKALEKGVRSGGVRLNETLVRVDLRKRIAQTNCGEYAFRYLVSTLPFDALLRLAGAGVSPGEYRANKVVVFNLGFDSKGWRNVHWVYFPDKKYSFYRVGFYDNIIEAPRMSLYVEIGAERDAVIDSDALLKIVLDDLRSCGIVESQKLISHHVVVMDPAYVHITPQSHQQVRHWRKVLATDGVYSIGRYGGWTYCSIEDNLVEARELARLFGETRLA